jgi:hypothetical protein
MCGCNSLPGKCCCTSGGSAGALCECSNLLIGENIQHDGNICTYIGFDTDKITIDACGPNIVLDDNQLTDKIVHTGQSKFINDINDVPNIYVQDSMIHSGDANTSVRFPANDQIALRTGGVDRVFVDTTGNVGIATTTPAYPLDVNGSAKVTTIRDTANSVGTAGQLLSSTGSALQWVAAPPTVTPAAPVNSVQFNNAGAFGGDSDFTFDSSTDTLSIPDITLTNYITHTGDSNTRVGFPANDQIALRTAGVDRVFVASTGNVGIGTTAPLTQFQVGDTGGIISLGGTPVSNGSGYLKFVNSNTVKNWQISTNDTVSGAFEIIPSTVAGGSTFTSPSFLIASDGKVGLGTSSPAYALDVNGSARMTAIRDNVNSIGTAGQVLSSTGSGLSWIAAGGSLPCSVLKETKTAGTSSSVAFPVGTSTQKRQLNVTTNSNLAVTVSGSPNWTFTIPTAGTYLFKGTAFIRANVVDSQTYSSFLVLNNNTLGLGAVLVGLSQKSAIGSLGTNNNWVCHLDGIYTITGTTVFTLDHAANTPFQAAIGGLANSVLGYEETFATLVITKIA